MLRQELTREEKNRLAERLLPGESILWTGKPRCAWTEKAGKEWKALLFLLFFSATFGHGCYGVATGVSAWNGDMVFTVAVLGICTFAALASICLLLLNAVQKSRRLSASLYALTDRRLLSVGPSSDGRGVLFLQFDGAALRKIRLAPHQGGTGDLIFRYQFPPGKKPVPQGWPALPDAERVVDRIRGVFPGAAVSRLP